MPCKKLQLRENFDLGVITALGGLGFGLGFTYLGKYAARKSLSESQLITIPAAVCSGLLATMLQEGSAKKWTFIGSALIVLSDLGFSLLGTNSPGGTSGPISFFSSDDTLYYQGQVIDWPRFIVLTQEIKDRNGLLEITFEEATTSSGFHSQVLDRIRELNLIHRITILSPAES